MCKEKKSIKPYNTFWIVKGSEVKNKPLWLTLKLFYDFLKEDNKVKVDLFIVSTDDSCSLFFLSAPGWVTPDVELHLFSEVIISGPDIRLVTVLLLMMMFCLFLSLKRWAVERILLQGIKFFKQMTNFPLTLEDICFRFAPELGGSNEAPSYANFCFNISIYSLYRHYKSI